MSELPFPSFPVPYRDYLSTLSVVHPFRRLSTAFAQSDLLSFRTPLLVVLEGLHDIAFLKAISRMFHEFDSSLPDLGTLETAGRLIFIPTGGGDLRHWAYRLASLGHRELHIYDREVPPMTAERQQVIDAINRRPGCMACLTMQRSMENNLHPDAIHEATDVAIDFDSASDVAECLARGIVAGQGGPTWQELPQRAHKRLRNKAKKLLNKQATTRMTPERLARQDPQGEVMSWLHCIRHLAGPPYE